MSDDDSGEDDDDDAARALVQIEDEDRDDNCVKFLVLITRRTTDIPLIFSLSLSEITSGALLWEKEKGKIIVIFVNCFPRFTKKIDLIFVQIFTNYNRFFKIKDANLISFDGQPYLVATPRHFM